MTFLVRLFKIFLEPAFRLGSPRPGSLAHPFELALQEAVPLPFLRLHLRFPFRFVKKEIRVVAIVRVTRPVCKFHDPGRYRIERIPVVRDKKARPGVVRQEFFSPLDRLCVKMVGRFIEDEEIGTRDDRLAQRHTPLLPAGEGRNITILRGHIEGMHRRFNPVVQVPPVPVANERFKLMTTLRCERKRLVLAKDIHDIVCALHDVLIHRQRRVELKVLRKVTRHDVPAPGHGSCIGLHDAGDDLQERRFA